MFPSLKLYHSCILRAQLGFKVKVYGLVSALVAALTLIFLVVVQSLKFHSGLAFLASGWEGTQTWPWWPGGWGF